MWRTGVKEEIRATFFLQTAHMRVCQQSCLLYAPPTPLPNGPSFSSSNTSSFQLWGLCMCSLTGILLPDPVWVTSLYLSGLMPFHDTPSCSEVHLFSPLQFSFIQYDTVCCYIFMWVDCLKVCSNDAFPRSGTLPSCSLFYSQNYSGIPFNLGELNHTCQVCALNKSLPSLHHPVATLASDDLPLWLVLSKYFFVGGC